MALRFFYRCEAENQVSPYDYSAGDTTGSLINSGVFSVEAARVGSFGLLRPASVAGGCNFTPTNIIPEIIASPASANVSMGFWFRPVGSVYATALNTAFRFRGTSSDDYISFSYQPTGGFGFGMKESAGLTAVAVVVPSGTIVADNWYFMVGRIDIPGDRLTIEVYDENVRLLSSNTITSDLAPYVPVDIIAASNGMNLGYGPGGHAFATHHDNFMVGDNYDEPLQKYALFHSYSQVAYNLTTRMFANGAFQSHSFVESTVDKNMKISSGVPQTANLTFYWNMNNETLDPIHDYVINLGDTSGVSSGGTSLTATAKRVGDKGMLSPASQNGGYTFTPDYICPGWNSPSTSAGSAAIWIQYKTNVVVTSNFVGLRFRGTVTASAIQLEHAASQEFSLRIGNATTEVFLTTTAVNAVINTWYFVVIRWDLANDKRAIEVYNENGVLIEKVEDTTTDLSASIPTNLTGSGSSWTPGVKSSGNGNDIWFDNCFVSPNYDEPLQSYMDIDSITELSLTGVRLKQMVEVAGAPSKLYANGTYSCPLFIEA